jgi:hypothetical protein
MLRKRSFSLLCKSLSPPCVPVHIANDLLSFFTFTGIFLELWSYWTGNRENLTPLHHEKRRNDAETGGAGGPPLDAPAQPTA